MKTHFFAYMLRLSPEWRTLSDHDANTVLTIDLMGRITLLVSTSPKAVNRERISIPPAMCPVNADWTEVIRKTPGSLKFVRAGPKRTNTRYLNPSGRAF